MTNYLFSMNYNIYMIIYLDLLILLNFVYDFIILYTVSYVLKRNISIKRLLISSLFGEISIIFLTLNFNYYLLITSKITLAIIMNIISFKYINIKYLLTNLSYFYMLSIILAGFIYYMYLNHINYVIILILIPIIFIIYIIQFNNKNKYKYYYKVGIIFNNNHKIIVNAYLDTGNNIIDDISLKPVIIVDKSVLKDIKITKFHYINVKVLNEVILLKCINIKAIEINNILIRNVALGISESMIGIDGINCLLNNKLRKDIIND